jgi:hypothetical protein
MTTEKAIEAIEERLQLILTIGTVADFNKWQQSTKITLNHIYGEKDERVLELTRIEAYRNFGFTGIERVPDARDEAKSYLGGLIVDIERLGLPIKEAAKKAGINVNVNQNNHQNQTTNVNINLELFIDAIKDELKGGQVKELQAILNSDEEPEKKKKSFVDKLKSFGSDVASNILANVLTNPKVYEQIGGLF